MVNELGHHARDNRKISLKKPLLSQSSKVPLHSSKRTKSKMLGDLRLRGGKAILPPERIDKFDETLLFGGGRHLLMVSVSLA
jgi:hypothetical protein